MKILDGVGLDFCDVQIVPQWTQEYSREKVNLEREFRFYHSPQIWRGVPLMIANMDGIGNLKLAKNAAKLKVITCLTKYVEYMDVVKYFDNNRYDTDYIWYTLGIYDEQKCKDITRKHGDYDLPSPNFCVDVANGHNQKFAEQVSRYRDISPTSIIMAGNVATESAAQRLIDVGRADIVKVGIGSGSHCSTRRVAGVGVPQLTAVMSTSHSVHAMKSAEKRMGLICSDGGCRTSGDITKAFGANSDFVMLGGLISGVDEHEGEWTYKKVPVFVGGEYPALHYEDGEKYTIKFYGSSSYEAQDKHGSRKDYRAEEGTVTEVKYKGTVESVLKEYMGGIRSGCTYAGASCLKDLAKCTQFIRVNRVHDINV